MEIKDELTKIDIKNRTCFSFDDIMRVTDIDFIDILLDRKSNENILTFDISYKTFMGAKALPIQFEKIDRFIKTYDGIRYLVLFAPERYNTIYEGINYLISEKVALHIVLIIIFQELELTHIILYLQKKH